MSKKLAIGILAGLSCAVLLCFILVKAIPAVSWADSLDESEIRQKVIRQYGGEILDMNRSGDHYLLELRQETGIYTLSLDAKNGEVVALQQKEAFETDIPQIEPDLDSSPETPANDQQNHIISSQEAEQIALNEIGGEVDDVELKEMGGAAYYLIEIERDDEQDAIVQVDAVSGAVMSVTWDD